MGHYSPVCHNHKHPMHITTANVVKLIQILSGAKYPHLSLIQRAFQHLTFQIAAVIFLLQTQ